MTRQMDLSSAQRASSWVAKQRRRTTQRNIHRNAREREARGDLEPGSLSAMKEAYRRLAVAVNAAYELSEDPEGEPVQFEGFEERFRVDGGYRQCQ